MSDTDAHPLIQPQVDAVEARVLGCLLEKQALTPEVYPLTVNAAVVASNQKTSREPVLNLEPGAVGHAMRTLEDKGLVKVVHGSRALRYEHRFEEVYGVNARQRALLCLMLLRGPQTLNELFTRCERLAVFDGPEAVRDTLERLCERSPPLAVRLPKGSGRREDRYMHLLCGAVSADAFQFAPDRSQEADSSALTARIERLEQELSTLRSEFDALKASL